MCICVRIERDVVDDVVFGPCYSSVGFLGRRGRSVAARGGEGGVG